MKTYKDVLTLPENLIWAWGKAKKLYAMNDALYNFQELAQFELDLERELEAIRLELLSGQYKLQTIKLLPQPKSPDKDGEPRMRQSFQISVRDQVAWIALINVLGPMLDEKMPSWSYGHRLYRSVWIDETEDNSDIGSRLQRGPYRHSTGALYRKFQHSWPLFRRHLFLTAKHMVKDYNATEIATEFDDADIAAYIEGKDLCYFQKEFWKERPEGQTELYYASIDLEKFYPNISHNSIMTALEKHLPEKADKNYILNLTWQMLQFKVSNEDIPLSLINLSKPEASLDKFDGIPTGLMCAGFLSNIAMLTVDQEINARIKRQKNIAHFRFVDDHCMLSYDFDILRRWIEEYASVLEINKIDAKINKTKYEPEELIDVLFNDFSPEPEKYEKAKNKCRIDGKHPTKLMTSTLAQVSNLAILNFDILSDIEKHQRIEQLEWLLQADMPDHEIRADTRVAFAAGRISVLAPQLFSPNQELLRLKRKEITRTRWDTFEDAVKESEEKQKIKELEEEQEKEWKKHLEKYFYILFRAFTEYPDKTRLMTRLLNYMRATGFNGLPHITEWLQENASGKNNYLSQYIATFALQTLSNQLLDCMKVLLSPELYLHAHAEAALKTIENISRIELNSYLWSETKQPSYFQRNALEFFIISYSATLETLRAFHFDKEIVERMEELVKRYAYLPNFSLPPERIPYNKPIGTWINLIENKISNNAYRLSLFWQNTAHMLNPANYYDWNCLRRYPKQLVEQGWSHLIYSSNILNEYDAGWLLDAAVAAPEKFNYLLAHYHQRQLTSEPIYNQHSHVITLVEYAAQESRTEHLSYVSLYYWIEHIVGHLDLYDPRAGEWTALEIIKQLIQDFLASEISLEQFNNLHPLNILVPTKWVDAENSKLKLISWEKWERIVSKESETNRVIFSKNEVILKDSRLNKVIRSSNTENMIAIFLEGIGRTLWFLLRGKISIPSIWNIRGNEKAGLIDFIRQDVDHLPVSSATMEILGACLKPKPLETLYMGQYQDFFGTGDIDTQFDPDSITNPYELVNKIKLAQEELAPYQITVLGHAPRQLIPAKINKLSLHKTSTEIGDYDE